MGYAVDNPACQIAGKRMGRSNHRKACRKADCGLDIQPGRSRENHCDAAVLIIEGLPIYTRKRE
jgi:hypothetical protein